MKFKHLFLAAAAMLSVGFMSSCSDDDKPSTPPTPSVNIMNGQKLDFGQGVFYMDAVGFNNELYALVVSVDNSGDESIEKYDLYKSTDGADWTKVEYTVDGAKGLIGGEGAKLVVNDGKLYVFSGMRTKAKDINGGEAEVEDGWMGPSPIVSFRVWESADGVAFKACETTMSKAGEEVSEAIKNMYANPYASVVSFKNKIVAYGGFMSTFGMMQSARALLSSADGQAWEWLQPVDAEGNNINLTNAAGSLFELNGKLYLVGGWNNWVQASNVVPAVFCTEDLTTWEKAELPEEDVTVPALYQAKAISTGSVVYLIGGEEIAEDGTHEIVTAIYRSEDAINWTKVETPEGYEGYRSPVVATKGNYAFILGGNTSASVGNYSAPADEDRFASNAWTIEIK